MQLQNKKTHKGRLSYTHSPLQTLWKGRYAGVALESSRICESQLKAAELAIKRTIRKNGEFWFRVHPNIPVTSKPAEVRMGKGKGNFKHLIYRANPGSIIFELQTNEILARQAFKIAASKLPLQLRFVSWVA
jgi:large subunit ribosomal protein L16